MSNSYGKNLKITIFGESHAPEIGVIIEGLPANEKIDEDELYKFMSRRKPGQNALTTPRVEADKPIFESGVKNGITDGTPIRAIIKNTNVHSSDYSNLQNIPRPGHADYTAYVKYGSEFDMRGGGPFSGRLTAPICIAGGICLQILNRHGINIGAHIQQIMDIYDDKFPLFPSSNLFTDIANKQIAVINDEQGIKMSEIIIDAAKEKDSVGGTIECAITGVKAGIGEPMFDGIENNISKAIFGIPAVKGIEFGSGFNCAKMYGSQNNDSFLIENGKVITKTNNHGGALGGISTGMPIVFTTAFKPTPSISKVQKSVNLKTMEETEIEINGRHDPCVVIRAVPVVEAVAATVIMDMLLD